MFYTLIYETSHRDCYIEQIFGSASLAEGYAEEMANDIERNEEEDITAIRVYSEYFDENGVRRTSCLRKRYTPKREDY